MKAKTQILAAAKLCYVAFSEYARIVQNVPVIPKAPRATFEPGTGWTVDGRLFKGTAAEVVAHYDDCQRWWNEEIKKYRAEQAALVRGVPLPDLER